ncbi:hypothetical protein SLS60_004204 [Paraconiothyrium brasiliense]|uniref:Uncharacterized protein n=1 Tax=Paraconiothyrium brasiliense TaxID=300254 RepID=A0ABR3RQT9_9PLEO
MSWSSLSNQRTPLTLGIFPLSSSHFQSANQVKKMFGLDGQKEACSGNSSQPMATHWTLRYREGTKYAWREPPILPILLSTCYWHKQATRAGPCTNPLHKPDEADKAVHYRNFMKEYDNETKGWKSDKNHEKIAKNVFGDWQRNHHRNWLYGDDYATIPGLLDWEMRCALDGNWRGLNHMLVDQELREPELMKPHPEYKLEWKLAVCVHREKQKQDEPRKAKSVEKVVEEERSRYGQMHTWNDSQLAGFIDLMDEQEEEDEQRALAEKEFEVATLLVSMEKANAEAVASSPKVPSPKKRKRTEKKEVTRSSGQSSSDGLRRSSRTKNPKLPSDSLNHPPAPRSPIGTGDNDAPTTNNEQSSTAKPRLVLRLPSACS